MTALEEKLIEVGTKLARATGHRMGYNCPKVSPAVPCTCGAAQQQLLALDAWDRLMQQIKEQ